MLTAKDIYEGLVDQLSGEGSCHYIEQQRSDSDFTNVTVDGAIDCKQFAEHILTKIRTDPANLVFGRPINEIYKLILEDDRQTEEKQRTVSWSPPPLP
jgi:hypothetical protein